MKWKDFTYQLVIEFCNFRGSRTFTLQEFFRKYQRTFQEFRPDNHNLLPKVRQQLQFLRDEGLLSFVDGRGTYTLRGIEILAKEIEDEKIKEVSREVPQKREYLIETFARNKGWVKEAKEKFGSDCMSPKCSNSFFKPDGTPYIEVHHIIPLCQGGEDGIWNLSVVCAHHHKMAHFADRPTQKDLTKILLREVEARLNS